MSKYVNDIVELIVEGKNRDAIKNCIEFFSSKDLESKKFLINILSQFNRVEKQFLRGLVNEENYTVRVNKIQKALLDELALYEVLENKKGIKNKHIKSFIQKLQDKDIFHDYIFFRTDHIEHHLSVLIDKTRSWSKEITFREIRSRLTVDKTYVDLNYFATPRRLLIEEYKEPINQSLISLLKDKITEKQNVVILGQPGAGKSTSIKKITHDILVDKNEKFSKGFPFVVLLRELNNIEFLEHEQEISLIKYLLNQLGIDVNIELPRVKILQQGEYNPESLEKQVTEEKRRIKQKNINQNTIYYKQRLVFQSVISILDEFEAVLILDGLDELKNSLKVKIIQQIEELSKGLRKSVLIITCRTGEYQYYIPKTEEFEICPLNDEQIFLFIKTWVTNNHKELYNQIKSSPFADTAIRPLTLVHLCTLFEKYGRIPSKPKSVYRKVINLLIEEWDRQRSISRETNFGEFDIDIKADFLSALAFHLTTKYESYNFNIQELRFVYGNICKSFDLNRRDFQYIFNEIEAHNGVFIAIGYELFQFAHKSIQEFLTADYIAKLPQYPIEFNNLQFPNETAIAIGVSSNPSLQLTHYIFNHIKNTSIDETRVFTFMNRLDLEGIKMKMNIDLYIALLKLFSLSYETSTDLKMKYDQIMSNREFTMIKEKFRNSYSISSGDSTTLCSYTINDNFNFNSNYSRFYPSSLNIFGYYCT